MGVITSMTMAVFMFFTGTILVAVVLALLFCEIEDLPEITRFKWSEVFHCVVLYVYVWLTCAFVYWAVFMKGIKF